MNIEEWKIRKKELHWTHDDLARESGVSRRTIARLFSGKENQPSPTLNTIMAIEKALGIENEKKSVMERPTSELAENFIKEFRDLFSDKTFHAYAELYRFMDEKQKIFIIGMIVGYLQDQGKKINIKF